MSREYQASGSAASDHGAPEPLADRESRNPLLRYLLHLGLPLSASLLVHVLVLVFAASYGIRLLAPDAAEIGQWEGRVVEATEPTDGLDWSEPVEPDVPIELSPDDVLENLAAMPRNTDLDLSELAAGSTGDEFGPAGGLGLGDGSLSLLGTGSGSGRSGTGGFGAGFGGGTRIGRAGIWNLNIRTNKVAYVVDFSGSIIVAVDVLKRELKRSISRLKPTQLFDVIIFYSSGGGQDERVRTESFKPQLEPANEANRREFFHWIDGKAPEGRTEPLAAIRRALALGPDAIFFFSDGYFDDALVEQITQANASRRTRIYCLVFDEILLEDTSGLPRETEGARRLKRVAEANRGTAKVVTGKDLTR